MIGFAELEVRMRYDPVWRRIKPDEYTTKLEGQFHTRLLRLDQLNNWGSLGLLYPHATASKQKHHFGLEWNAKQFLDADADRIKHQPSLRGAAHVAHWGHLPRSYAGEEAVIRAAHVTPASQDVLKRLVDEVVAFGQLRCEDKGHRCLSDLLRGDRPFELYRWLSAWLVKRDWKPLYKAVCDAERAKAKAAGTDFVKPDEAELKHRIVATLVCQTDRGHRVLAKCNQADYVPRDLQQCGTAWMTFDIEALWEGNPLGEDAAREWDLIEAARDYLNDRVFQSPEALLAHSLVARAIAGGLVARGFTLLDMTSWTNEGDSFFENNLAAHHKKRLKGVYDDIRHLESRWDHVGTFWNVAFAPAPRLELEDQLSLRKGAARLSYPFISGVSIVAELDDDADIYQPFVTGEVQMALVHVHRNRAATKKLRPTLDVLERIAERQMPYSTIGSSLLGWLLNARVADSSAPLRRTYSRIAEDRSPEIKRAIRRLLQLKAVETSLKHSQLFQILTWVSDPEAPPSVTAAYGYWMTQLPWTCLRQTRGQHLLQIFRDRALEIANTRKDPDRGSALEIAVAMDHLLQLKDARYAAVFAGLTQLGKDGVDEREWDVIALRHDGDGSWSLSATECSVTAAKAKDEEGREKLDALRQALDGRFEDLRAFETKFASPGSTSVEYRDACRGWKNFAHDSSS